MYSGVKVAHAAETSKPTTAITSCYSSRVQVANAVYCGRKLIIDKSMCVVKFNEKLSCLNALEAKQAKSTPLKQELCSAP